MTRILSPSSAIRSQFRGMALGLAVGAPILSLGAQHAPQGHGKNYQITARQGTDASQQVEFTLDRYTVDTVDEGGTTYSRVNCLGGVNSTQKGFAELPFFHATLQLAQAQKCRVVIKDESHKDIILDHPMLPSKGVIYRNEDPRTIERIIAPESLKGGWFPTAAVDITDPFIFRDVRGVNVYLHPFQYEAATQTLRVTTRMVVSVEPEGELRSRDFTAPHKVVAEMKPVYQSLFLNTATRGATRWSHEVGEVGDMLVIYTDRYASAIKPYVQWKREKGYKVKVIQVAKETNVKSLIQKAYTANPDLLYVQLVGDWDDIQSDLGPPSARPMDPALGCVAGNDAYPELIIGRFSANTAEEVTTQVNKAINYEKNPDVLGTWYKKGLVIASSDGAGFGDDDECDIQHETNIRDGRLLRTTYSEVFSIFGDGSTKNMIIGPINEGLSLINYSGHGNANIWETTNFTNSDVMALNNGNQLPVICAVACSVGSFQRDCLAESWLRNPHGGAVAGMFATIDQPWQPPMRGQDYFNDLLTGGYDYAALPGDGISTTYGRSTFGSLAVNATVLMYAESSQKEDLVTLQTWTIFGDASLQVRSDTPKAIALSNETVNPGSAFSTQVTADGVGVGGALVSLSRGEQVFSGLTDDNGNITLNHDLNAGVAKLVVTGQNTTTIIRDITIGQPLEDVSVTISPAATTLNFGNTCQFNATIIGTTNNEVTWTCTGGGIITNSGLYVAPNTDAVCTVKATSVVDPTRYATAVVRVTPKLEVSVNINPPKVNLYLNATMQFVATVINSSDTSVTWSCSSESTITNSGLYTAPSMPGNYFVKASSNADPSKFAIVNVTVSPRPILVSIIPAVASTMMAGDTKQYTALVTGDTNNTSVSWTCSGGRISDSGLYTAPSIGGSYTIKATSAADPTKYSTIAVNVFDIDVSTYCEVENNESLATANPVPNATRKVIGTIGTSGDIDSFLLKIEPGKKMKVSMTGPVSNYDLYLYDSSNTLLSTGTPATTIKSVSYTNTGSSPITCCVQVKGKGSNDYSDKEPYCLTLFESDAISIVIKPAKTSVLANTQKQFTATVTGSGSSGITWSCKDDAGSIDSLSGLYTAPNTPGTYLVKATSVVNESIYTFATVNVISNDETTLYEVESNDSFSEANNVSDSTLAIVGYLATGKDKDTFKINVDPGVTLQVDMTGPDQDYDLYLYDSRGGLLKSSHGNCSTESVTYTNPDASPAFYFIHVKGLTSSDYSKEEPYCLILTKFLIRRFS